MKRFGTHKIGIDQGDVLLSDFDSDGPMWTGDGPRELRHPVRFAEGFLVPPAVVVGLTMWDISNGANARVDVTADDIGIEGFEIRFRTWGDSRIARVRVGWQAIGALVDDDLWEIG